MIPEYDKATRSNLWVHVVSKETGLQSLLPESDLPGDGITVLDPQGPPRAYSEGWFARMACPMSDGATEWEGPFDTYLGAKEYIRSTFEVDPLTGRDLPYPEAPEDIVDHKFESENR